MSLDPGRLNRLVEVYKATISQDSHGQEIKTWPSTPYRKLWCEFTPMGGRETFLAGQKVAERRGEFRTHYRTDINAENYRLLYDGLTWDIERAEEDMRFASREVLLVSAIARIGHETS